MTNSPDREVSDSQQLLCLQEFKVLREDDLGISLPICVLQPFVDALSLVDDLLTSCVVLIVIDEKLIRRKQVLKNLSIFFDMLSNNPIGFESQPTRGRLTSGTWVLILSLTSLAVRKNLQGASVTKEVTKKSNCAGMRGIVRSVMLPIQRRVHLAPIVSFVLK